MPVTRFHLDLPAARIPHHIEVLLDETAGPLSDWQAEHSTGSFVPADYVLLFDALAAIRPHMTARPSHFLEWGSGFGIATLLASALGWQARGIEIQLPLVQESRRFNEVFDLSARFYEGSFFPEDVNVVKKLQSLCARSELIYVYPWPDQEVRLFDLFDRVASPGTWLLTYYGVEDVRIFRKQGTFTSPNTSDSPSA